MAKALLSRAVTLLHSDTYTCILCDRDRVLTSRSNGIAPLLTRIEDKEDLRGMVCADKIIGKAAAMLLLYSGVRAAHGDVMSVKAKNLLEQAGVAVSYGVLTDGIINRTGDGPCPMEQAVADLTDPGDAPCVLRDTLERLKRLKG